jgi:hypothetical protein
VNAKREEEMIEIRFDTTPEEFKTIVAIVERYQEMCSRHGAKADFLSVQMDLSAAHANGCPLDLESLLAADDLSFAHDVAGISRHIDRNTGKLMGHFLPRFAKV